MRRYALTVILVIISAAQASALTMQEAVQKAVTNNYQVKAQMQQAEAGKYSADAAKTPFMPSLTAGYSYLKSSENAYVVEDELSTFDISLGYNLFNGFSDKFNVSAAKASYQAAKYNIEAVKQDIALSAKKAYINVLAAIDSVTVAENAHQLLQNQLKDITLSYKVGYVAKNEVLKVEAELASSQQSVLSAKSSVKTAVFALENVMAEDISPDETFEPLGEYSENIGDLDTLKSQMFESRSELKYLNELISAKQYGIKSVNGGYLPKVNVGATYYSYGQDTNPSGRDYTYDNETVFAVTVDMNLFDGLYKYNTAKSLTAEKLAMIQTLRETKANMTLQLKNALENFDLAKASLNTAEKEVESARENYRITQNQFKQKVATNTDLMDARVMLTRAENTYNNAKFNIQRAIADVERITEKSL